MWNLLAKLFTWWSGATIGTLFTVGRRGRLVGQDSQGNRYYQETKNGPLGYPRRWVIYNGYAEFSRVPPLWHGWLNRMVDEPPENAEILKFGWMKPHVPNLSGSVYAYHPKGSLYRIKSRDDVIARDYEAWSPGDDPALEGPRDAGTAEPALEGHPARPEIGSER
jgi:NADH:ubiquinone oxidoreductase subunit